MNEIDPSPIPMQQHAASLMPQQRVVAQAIDQGHHLLMKHFSRIVEAEVIWPCQLQIEEGTQTPPECVARTLVADRDSVLQLYQSDV